MWRIDASDVAPFAGSLGRFKTLQDHNLLLLHIRDTNTLPLSFFLSFFLSVTFKRTHIALGRYLHLNGTCGRSQECLLEY